MKKLFIAAFMFVFSLTSNVSADGHGIKMGIILGFTGPIESLTPAMAASAKLAFDEASDSGSLLNGEKIFDLLCTGSPFNFNDFRSIKGSSTQTLLAQIDVIIHHNQINSVNLFVRRSFSEHLMSWINDSASRL